MKFNTSEMDGAALREASTKFSAPTGENAAPSAALNGSSPTPVDTGVAEPAPAEPSAPVEIAGDPQAPQPLPPEIDATPAAAAYTAPPASAAPIIVAPAPLPEDAADGLITPPPFAASPPYPPTPPAPAPVRPDGPPLPPAPPSDAYHPAPGSYRPQPPRPPAPPAAVWGQPDPTVDLTPWITPVEPEPSTYTAAPQQDWITPPDWAAAPPTPTPPPPPAPAAPLAPPPRWTQPAPPPAPAAGYPSGYGYPADPYAEDRFQPEPSTPPPPPRPQAPPVSPPATTRRAPTGPQQLPPPPPRLGSANDHAFALQDQRREGPRRGFRRTLHRLGVPVGKSPAELAYDRDIAIINKTVRYSKTIGFAAFKGGVGKTTCALCVASTIAEHRTKGEVVAIDTDDRGSLARRVRGEQHSDLRQFVADPDLQTPNEVKSHMMANAHRLSVLGSSHSPLANALQPAEYVRALQILQANHLFVAVDMDTSAASPAYETIMHSLDALVLVTSVELDSAEAGLEIREWLRARDLQHLAANTLVLINHRTPAKPYLDLDSTASYYRNTEACEVLEIPWDAHLSEAGPISLDLLNKSTRRQFVKAAATLLEMLPST